MKNFLLSIFATQYGTILRFIVALIVGAIVALCAKIGLVLSDEQVVTLAGIVTAAVSGAIGEFVLKNQGQSIAEIQAKLKDISPAVFIDKWAGPTTIRAVNIATDAAKKAAADEFSKRTEILPR